VTGEARAGWLFLAMHPLVQEVVDACLTAVEAEAPKLV